MVSVLVVDDHPIYREGVRRIFRKQPDLAVVAEADTIRDAICLLRQHRPDLLLLDLRLRDGSGLEVLPRLHRISPRTRALVISGYGPEQELPALRAGARGFVSKDVAAADLLDAIRAVLRGEIWAAPETTGRPVSAMLAEDRVAVEALTSREFEVLKGVARGQRNGEIAEELSISPQTVKVHVGHIMEKLDIHDRLQLALYGRAALPECSAAAGEPGCPLPEP